MNKDFINAAKEKILKQEAHLHDSERKIYFRYLVRKFQKHKSLNR